MSARADLMLGKPSNLSVPPGMGVRVYVDGDVYDICTRLAEVSPALQVITLTGQENKYTHVIAENCDDGVTRLIFKVGPASKDTPLLDGRVVEKCQRLLQQPMDKRIEALDKEAKAWEEADREYRHEKLYEEMGRPMLHQLEKSGFIQRPVSYPKAGVATRGKRAR